MSGQPIWIGLDLELTHLATDAGNFRNARHALQFVLEEEILQRAQFINIVTVMSIDQRIFEYPADTRCIRPQCRGDTGRQAGHRLIEILEHARARPIRRSEEHPSELQSLMRNSFAVFCLKKKQNKT